MRILIQISTPESIQAVNEIQLYDTSGQEKLLAAAAELVTGRTQGLYVANITLPNQVGS